MTRDVALDDGCCLKQADRSRGGNTPAVDCFSNASRIPWLQEAHKMQETNAGTGSNAASTCFLHLVCFLQLNVMTVTQQTGKDNGPAVNTEASPDKP